MVPRTPETIKACERLRLETSVDDPTESKYGVFTRGQAALMHMRSKRVDYHVFQKEARNTSSNSTITYENQPTVEPPPYDINVTARALVHEDAQASTVDDANATAQEASVIASHLGENSSAQNVTVHVGSTSSAAEAERLVDAVNASIGVNETWTSEKASADATSMSQSLFWPSAALLMSHREHYSPRWSVQSRLRGHQ
eukprot:TRINITY_DN18870_c0_g1_i2.p1 TRINITY_DN18870_c0_g1~~TRINITY_DN18870_c0_g1_i2.p1  ORF type:complete len:199 (-),score=18.75 TRINITY_DN18870_c0_g1_i2:10-606(-)